jgi:SAM-dependent methyltransferase
VDVILNPRQSTPEATPSRSKSAADVRRWQLRKGTISSAEWLPDRCLSDIQFVQAGLGEGKLECNQFDRALLVTVLGEVPDREAVLKEIYAVLKPGGILSVTEIIFDPHFQGRNTVTRLAETAGFRVQAFFGNRLAYTLNLEKPSGN